MATIRITIDFIQKWGYCGCMRIEHTYIDMDGNPFFHEEELVWFFYDELVLLSVSKETFKYGFVIRPTKLILAMHVLENMFDDDFITVYE